jgi:prepilin-type N-terminal cleavage/methylation domain-containing protein
MRRAFTLIELMIVIAILAILAAILFPVFSSAKEQARRGVCLNSLRQAQLATTIYANDYDDMFVVVNHQPNGIVNSRIDRTWVQILMPYVRRFDTFFCPSAKMGGERPEMTFDEDLVPGDTYSRFYQASQRVNVGYNYLYLAPVARVGNTWASFPRSMTSVGDASQTLLFVDSIGDRISKVQSLGSGSWLVSPPCRYSRSGSGVIDTFGFDVNVPVKTFNMPMGWDLNPLSPFRYGAAYPWHTQKINIIRVDGNASSVAPDRLAEGCNLLPNWSGVIEDRSRYAWNGINNVR